MEFITQNGGVAIEIKPASFKDACALRKAVSKSLMGQNLLGGADISNILDIKVDSIMQLLINIDTSEDFEKSIQECLKVCIYDKGGKNLRITSQLFDDIESAREDYYEIIIKCCEVNLRPFFKSLASEFKARLKMIPENSPEQ